MCRGAHTTCGGQFSPSTYRSQGWNSDCKRLYPLSHPTAPLNEALLGPCLFPNSVTLSSHLNFLFMHSQLSGVPNSNHSQRKLQKCLSDLKTIKIYFKTISGNFHIQENPYLRNETHKYQGCSCWTWWLQMLGPGTTGFITVGKESERESRGFQPTSHQERQKKKFFFLGVGVEDDFKFINEKNEFCSIMTNLQDLMWDP